MNKIINVNDVSYMILGKVSANTEYSNEQLKAQYSLADTILRNGNELTGFCFTPQDGNSLLSSIAITEWFLYPHSYEDKIQCLKPLFFDEV